MADEATGGVVSPAVVDITGAAPAAAEQAATQDWSPDWRLKMAGGDEKRAKSYERYASPKDIADSHLSLQQQLSTGEYKRKLADNATPEQVSAWRKDNGIPETPEKYDLNMPDGLVLGENDLPVAKAFAAEMHKVNADQKTVQTAITWWTKAQQAGLEAQQTQDAEFRKQTEDVLRADWGGEYRMNEAAIGNALAGMPEDLSQTLQGARGADGKLLFDNPQFRSYLLKQAYLENPARMLVPGNDGNSLDNINAQLADIKKISQTEPQRYNKDVAMQQRRTKLLEAQQVLTNRKSA